MNYKYRLSRERQDKKEKYEQQISKKEDRQNEIREQIKQIRRGETNLSIYQRRVKILEAQIEIEELENEIAGLNSEIGRLYTSEIDEEIIKNKQSKQRRFLNMYRRMKTYKEEIDDCELTEDILELKKQLEIAKKNNHMISQEEAEKSIKEIEDSGENNAYTKECAQKDIVNEKTLYDIAKGIITKEEGKKRKEEYEEDYQDMIPTNEELEAIFEEIANEALKKEQEYNAKKENIASRSVEESSTIFYEMVNQNINEEHEQWVHRYTPDIERYVEDIQLSSETDDKKGKKIGERYANIVEDNKKEVARVFGELEFNNENKEQNLLRVEKMNNISPRRLNELVNGEMFVATYEKEVDGVIKPIKEYYKKNEKGEMECIGIGDEEEETVKFNIGNGKHWTVDNERIGGEIEESLTQHEIVDRIQKNTIQKDIKSGQVSQISKIMDIEFLEDFAKQCGVKEEDWSYSKDFYIVSTIDEKGKEQYDIVYEEKGMYTRMQGLNQEEEEGKEIRVATPYTSSTEKTKTLQEFTTKNGSRYAITRDEEDNIVLSEIIREKDGKITSKSVDSYSFTKDDIIPIAKEDEVVLENEDAREAINDLEKEPEKEQDNKRNR